MSFPRAVLSLHNWSDYSKISHRCRDDCRTDLQRLLNAVTRSLARNVRTTLPGQNVQYDSNASGSALAMRPGATPVPVLRSLANHYVHGTAPAYLYDNLRLTSEVFARRRLGFVDTTTTLMVSSTCR